MSKKAVRKKKVQQKPKTPTWVWAAVAGAVLLVVGGLVVLFGGNGTPSGFTPEVTGAPAIKADRAKIDEGDVKLGVTKRTVYTLKNVGDKPLEILGEPQVELVEGC